MVGIEQPENLTKEEIEIAMNINLDLTEVRKDEVVGRAMEVWQKSPGRMQELKQWWMGERYILMKS